ncbi:transposase [Corynebacterium sp. MSK122]|uniref:transposase n=1 Tax=Corynebacterium sp. MSK122 TaxID=3050206 RepID=UPI003AF1721B
MDIARQLSIGSSPVYRIGIELGLWKRNPHGRKAAATTGRCSYLQLRANALGRKDAALACGIHPRNAADIDKGVIKLSTGRVPFVPAGPDVALYNRLMQVIGG